MYIKKAMIGTSSHNKTATESSRLMRGAVRDFDEYILELQLEIIVGLDVVAHVTVLEYYVHMQDGLRPLIYVLDTC